MIRKSLVAELRGHAQFTRITLLVSCIVFLSSEANAEWKLGTVLDLSIIHSDNIRLAPGGAEESESVYSISPTFTASTASDRVTADIRYRPEALFYENNSSADDIYHVVDAIADATLVKDLLYIGFDAAKFQSSESPDGQFLTSNIPISGNRLDSTTWGFSPRLQRRLGQADLLVTTRYQNVSYDRKEFLDSDEKSAGLSVDNFSVGSGVSWALRYEYTRMDFGAMALPWEYQQASAELGYWVSDSLRVFVSGGVETPFDEFYVADMSDSFWESGFEYNPNERLNLVLAAGERGFGTSARGSFTYRMRRGGITISYIEDPSTQNEVRGSRRPLQTSDNLDDFLSRPGVNNQFIRKRAELIGDIDLAKTSVSLRVFSEKREDVFSLDGIRQQKESFEGAALRLSWQLGAKLGLGLSADIAKRDGASSLGEDLTRTSLDISYRMSRRFSLIARALRTVEDGNQTTFAGYTENQYHLTLRAEF